MCFELAGHIPTNIPVTTSETAVFIVQNGEKPN